MAKHAFAAANGGNLFDRMLAAQSLIEGTKLVTSDRAFSTLPGVDIFW